MKVHTNKNKIVIDMDDNELAGFHHIAKQNNNAQAVTMADVEREILTAIERGC